MGHERLPELVEGPRLILRRWTSDDEPVLSAMVRRNIEHLRPWMPWAEQEPLAAEHRFMVLKQWEADWKEGGDALHAIWLKGPDARLQAVGTAGLHRRRGPGGLEIGYWVDKDHLQMGIATEAAKMLTSAGFSLASTEFIQIHHDKANTLSAKIPRRLRYTLLGEFADVPSAPGERGIDCAWHMPRKSWDKRTNA